ncbi:MAG: metal-dependent hydrolase [Luteolibacter sp.]
MDWITQAALGAAMGERMLGKRLGKRAMAWGALFGIFPDFDGILSLFLDTAHRLAIRNGPSHSLWLLGLVAYGLSCWLVRHWTKEKISKWQAGGFVFALFCGHLLLECLTADGAGVLWPFSPGKVTFNTLFPLDFLLSGPLVVIAVWLAVLPEEVVKKSRGKKAAPPSKRGRLCDRGLGLASGYVLLAVAAKFSASAGFDADLKRRITTYQRRMEAPTAFNIFLWRAVVDRGDELWVGYRTVFEMHETPVRWTIYPKGKTALAGREDTREMKTLAQTTSGWWIARTNSKGVWLGDLRPPESRIWGDKKGMVDSRLAYSWVFTPDAKGDRLRQTDDAWRNAGEMLNRMSGRLVGNRGLWEANPRLAGVSGSLPEFLAVEE